MKQSTLVPLLAAVSQVTAFWRMRCSNIQVGRIDPIINPGSISSHVHTIAGPMNFNTTSTNASLANSFCTSCQVQDDKSAYWTPQMYYQRPDGTFVPVRNDGTVVYYLGRGDDRNNIVPFPPGFKMLSGDSGARSYDNVTMTYGTAGQSSRPVADRVSFNCLTTGYSPLPETPGMIRTDCANGLRAQIQFQSCWDGVNLYKADQSHVAYLSRIDNGVCPPTHPKLLPHLFYEIYYYPNEVATTQGGTFMFANGDTTGYGFHGDFLNGWNTDVLQAGISQCINSLESGVVEDCPPLNASNDPYFSQNCPEQPALVNEQVKGVLSALPGCNPPSSGPQRAINGNCSSSPSTNQVPSMDGMKRPIPTKNTIVSTSSGTASYQGCYTEASGMRALNGSSTTNQTGMTTELCAGYCMTKGYTMFGTEYAQECYCGNSISTNQTSQSDCGMACTGNLTQFCGAGNRLSVWKVATAAVTSGKSSTTSIVATTSTVSISSTAVASPTGTSYIGCYSEGSSSRAMVGASTSSDNMTVEVCAKFAQASNLKYFGVEYSRECYASNTIGTSQISSSSCNMACSGNSGQICGGSNALSVFQNSAFVQPSNPATVPVSNTQFVYAGCYSEGTSGRALPDYAYSNSSMTVGACVASCYNLGYTYAGLEYMHECYCNNAGIVNGGTSAPGGDADCTMLCDGNKVQYCGGSDRLSVYHLKKNMRIAR